MRTRVAKMIPKIIPSSTPYSQRLPPAFQAPSCQESKRRGLGSAWGDPRPGPRAERTRKSSPYRSRAVGRRDVQAKAVLKIGPEWPPTTRRDGLGRPTCRHKQSATVVAMGTRRAFKSARTAFTSAENYGVARRTYQAVFAFTFFFCSLHFA